MDWITGIQRALDYTEAHLTGGVDYDAVFTCRGKMPNAFKDTYQRIVTEFFPQSNYEYGQGVELEVYPSADTQNPDYTCEIWIAVKEKK